MYNSFMYLFGALIRVHPFFVVCLFYFVCYSSLFRAPPPLIITPPPPLWGEGVLNIRGGGVGWDP